MRNRGKGMQEVIDIRPFRPIHKCIRIMELKTRNILTVSIVICSMSTESFSKPEIKANVPKNTATLIAIMFFFKSLQIFADEKNSRMISSARTGVRDEKFRLIVNTCINSSNIIISLNIISIIYIQ